MAPRDLPPELIKVVEKTWRSTGTNTSMKAVWSDPETKRQVAIARFAAGFQYQPHTHRGDELVFMIEGTLTDESGTLTGGNVGYRPIGCTHSLSSRSGGTAISYLTGDVENADAVSADAIRTQIFHVNEMVWKEQAREMRMKNIWEDKATSRRLVLGQLDPGATVPRHRHIGDELVYVIEGSIFDAGGEVTPGCMSYRPKGCVHEITTHNGATVLAMVWGNTEPA